MPKKREGRGLKAQLREAIRNSGISLNGLARRTGIGADRLSRFIRDERGLSLDAVEALCDALGLRLTGGKPSKGNGKEKEKRGGGDLFSRG